MPYLYTNLKINCRNKFNVFKYIALVFLLLSSTPSFAAQQCGKFFSSSEKWVESIEAATSGSFIRAVRALNEISDRAIDPRFMSSLKGIESSKSFGELTETHLLMASQILNVNTKELTSFEVTPENVFNFIARIAQYKIRDAARRAYKNNQVNSQFEITLVREQELYRIKFLAYLLNPVPLKKGSLFSREDLTIGGDAEIHFTSTKLKVYQLKKILEKLDMPSEFFTTRDFFNFFNLTANKQEGYYFKSVLRMFMPIELTSKSNWNYIAQLVNLYNKKNVSDVNWTIAEISKQTNIEHDIIDGILNRDEAPDSTSLENLKSWVSLKLSQSLSSETISIPESLRIKSVFTDKNNSEYVVNEYFRINKGTDPVPSSAKRKRTKSEDVFVEDPLNEALFVHHNLTERTVFNKFMELKMHSARRIFRLSLEQILSRLDIDKARWDNWMELAVKPRTAEDSEYISDLLMSLDTGELPRARQPSSAKRGRRSTDVTDKRGEDYSNGAVKSIPVKDYIEANGLAASTGPLEAGKSRVDDESFVNLPVNEKITKLRKRAGFKTIRDAVVQLKKMKLPIETNELRDIESGKLNKPNDDTLFYLSTIFNVEFTTLKSIFYEENQSFYIPGKSIKDRVDKFAKNRSLTPGKKVDIIRALLGYENRVDFAKKLESEARRNGLPAVNFQSSLNLLVRDGWHNFRDENIYYIIASTLRVKASDIFGEKYKHLNDPTLEREAKPAESEVTAKVVIDSKQASQQIFEFKETLEIEQKIEDVLTNPIFTVSDRIAKVRHLRGFTSAVKAIEYGINVLNLKPMLKGKWEKIEIDFINFKDKYHYSFIAQTLKVDQDLLFAGHKPGLVAATKPKENSLVGAKEFSSNDSTEVNKQIKIILESPDSVSFKVKEIRKARGFEGAAAAVKYGIEELHLEPIDAQKWRKLEKRTINFKDKNDYLFIAEVLGVDAKDLFGALLHEKQVSKGPKEFVLDESADVNKKIQKILRDLSLAVNVKVTQIRKLRGLRRPADAYNYGINVLGLTPIPSHRWSRLERGVVFRDKTDYLFISKTLNVDNEALFGNILNNKQARKEPREPEKFSFNDSAEAEKTKDEILQDPSLAISDRVKQIRELRGFKGPADAFNYAVNILGLTPIKKNKWASLERGNNFRNSADYLFISETLKVDHERLFGRVLRDKKASVGHVEFSLNNSAEAKKLIKDILQNPSFAISERVRLIRKERGFESTVAAVEYGIINKGLEPIDAQKWRKFEQRFVRFQNLNDYMFIAKTLDVNAVALLGDKVKFDEQGEPISIIHKNTATKGVTAEQNSLALANGRPFDSSNLGNAVQNPAQGPVQSNVESSLGQPVGRQVEQPVIQPTESVGVLMNPPQVKSKNSDVLQQIDIIITNFANSPKLGFNLVDKIAKDSEARESSQAPSGGVIEKINVILGNFSDNAELAFELIREIVKTEKNND